MNENYLWDKTGNDFEIEKLENALQAFRYAETAAPSLPAKTASTTRKTARVFFRLGFAFAACLSLIIIGLSLWNRISDNNLNFKNESAKVFAPPADAPVFRQSFIEIPADTKVEKSANFKKASFSSAKKIETARHLSKQKILKEQKFIPAFNLKNETTARNSAPVGSTVKLTNEEKYAYSQLMLALSITSAKLKIVKDKVDNSEKSNAVLKDGGR
ncbi:MAG: hypothetical protein ACR2GD_01360 [Pyrinomonadaceae bacterium]